MTAFRKRCNESTNMSDDADFIGMNSFVLASVVVVCVIIDVVIKKYQVSWLPESAAAILLGVIIGLIATLFGHAETEALKFHPDVFFFILLPPIIFDAGFTLKKRNFFKNMGSILTFAVLGTIISSLVIGYGLYAFAKAGLIRLDSKNPLECLMFGALISATDPVATLNIFSSRSVDAPPLLYSIVFGESVLNDAIAIVLYKTFETFRAEPVFHSTSLLTAVVKFFGISIGSTLVGVAVAMLLSFATKRVDFRNTAAAHYELTLVALTAYISYFLAEIFSLSGIMSLFFCGVCLAHYNFYNCSVESQDASHLMFKSLAQLCETFVFAFLGITTGISISSSSGVSWDVGLVFLTLFWCFLSRAIQVFPLSYLLNLRRAQKIPLNMQVCIWFAGLRGAIAFALSLQVTTPGGPYIVTSTLVTVIFTTLVCGVLTEPLLRKMAMRSVDMEQSNEATSSIESQPAEPRSSFASWWRRFDDEYIKTWFGGRSPDDHASTRVNLSELGAEQYAELGTISDDSQVRHDGSGS